MRVKTNKKGNVSVLLAMIFVGLMTATVVFVNVSAMTSTYSYCDGVLQLAGRSILSEYHLALKEYYGIMAFKGYEEQVDKKLKFYANGSFSRENIASGLLGQANRLTLIKPKIKNLNCQLMEYSLIAPNNFESDILDYMKYPKLSEMKENKELYKGKEVQSTGILVNQRIINELPSAGLEESNFNIAALIDKGLPSFSELTSQSTDQLIVDEYILKTFNYRQENKSKVATFFQNEVEYILYGKLSDSDNQNKFMNNFSGLRFVLNSAHIYGDTQKRNAVIELAEILTPGPEAVITAIVLIEVWAAVETANDRKLLLGGKNVALYKSNQQWAMSLESSRTETSEGSHYVEPVDKTGFSYKEYLRLFLFFQDREEKLARMMDLIQINIQGNCDESFYIKDCYTGLGYNVEINGQEYFYVQKY